MIIGLIKKQDQTRRTNQNTETTKRSVRSIAGRVAILIIGLQLSTLNIVIIQVADKHTRLIESIDIFI